MRQRLQKILSERGVASRRKAENIILEGRVTVNGVTAQLGESADPEQDRISVDGLPLPPLDGYVYLMLNKPRGYVTTLSDERGRRMVSELVAGCGKKVYPVGRLDMDSEGLLLFTNDGAFAHTVMHPRYEIEKTYYVQVSGFSPQSFERLRKPVVLDGYTIKAPSLNMISSNAQRGAFEITIHEGRNRQIRRMCEMTGMHVTRLVRIREGSLQLGDLPSGRWRCLTDEELERIMQQHPDSQSG
jgi:23S rRNA pseudouridine2605 synthase